MTARKSIIFVAVLMLAATAPVALTTAQESVYEVDTSHGLTEQSAIDQYRSSGVATGEIYGLNATVTVADDAGDAGLSELLYRSTGRVFLRIDYNEEIARTLRLHIPREYVAPQLKQGLEAADSDVTADLEPTQDRNHTAVTVTFEEPSTVVFPISASRGAISSGRSTIGDMIANVTGFELPSLTDDGAEWHYVSSSELSDNQTDYIPSNATTIQYDASASSDTEAEWVPVPDCDGGTDYICTYSKAGHPDRTYLLSTGADAPEVRYREGTSVSGELGTAINDAVNGAEDLVDSAFSLFGGDDGGE